MAEDKNNASSSNPNRFVFVDRRTGRMATFAELAQQFSTPEENLADEPTGTEFSPDGKILFLNLQRRPDFGLTLGISGPFARWTRSQRSGRPGARSPLENDEIRMLRQAGVALPVGAAAALVHLRRRGRIDEIPAPLEEVVAELGEPRLLEEPKRRLPK